MRKKMRKEGKKKDVREKPEHETKNIVSPCLLLFSSETRSKQEMRYRRHTPSDRGRDELPN